MTSDNFESVKYNLGICESIQAESVGRPGQRYFRLRVHAANGSALLWLEKEQLYELAIGVKRLLKREAHPFSVETPTDTGSPIVDHDFKIGRLTVSPQAGDIGYLLLVHVIDQDLPSDELDDVPDLSVSVDSEKLDRLADEAIEVCDAGRPRCPLCGVPMDDDDDHVCPRSNGHHRHES